MILLTPDLRERLLTNGRHRGLDHVPVVKFFNPLGIGTWLATELDEDGDTLFGLAELGDPELGSFSLAEMQALELPLGMGIERDTLFEGEFPLSVYAQEADRLSWIAGGFAQADKVDFDYVFNMPAFGPASLSASSYSRRELAGFGEATWNVVGGLDLTAGIRLAREHHELANNAPFQGAADFTLPTPKFRAAYRFDDAKLVYVSATRGARSGGFNRLGANDAYESEFLWSYEAGFKTEWLNRTVTLNGAAFYIDWTNQQIKSMVAPGIIETINAGKSHSQGFELEASWRPVHGLELSGYLGVVRGEYDQFIGQAGTSLAGNRLVNTPTMTAGLASQYRWALAQWPLMGVVRAEYHYIGNQYFDPENRLEQPGYSLVNLRAGVENERFSAMVFVKNLFDTDYRSYGYRDFQGSALATDIAVAGQSRMFGLTVSARY